MASTVLGAMADLFAADPVLSGLVPGGLWTETIPSEIPLPFVAAKDVEDDPEWITDTARIEKHKIEVQCFAKATSTPGAANPAENLASNVERVMDWEDLPIPNTTPIGFRQTRHVFKKSDRQAPDGERVYEVLLAWEVTFERYGLGQ